MAELSRRALLTALAAPLAAQEYTPLPTGPPKGATVSDQEALEAAAKILGRAIRKGNKDVLLLLTTTAAAVANPAGRLIVSASVEEGTIVCIAIMSVPEPPK